MKGKFWDSKFVSDRPGNCTWY